MQPNSAAVANAWAVRTHHKLIKPSSNGPIPTYTVNMAAHGEPQPVVVRARPPMTGTSRLSHDT